MESQSFDNDKLLFHSLKQIKDACEMIKIWNQDVESVEDYLSSPSGMKTLAATCMLIESIGEASKKIDRHFYDFLSLNAPEIPWKEIKGMRDYIAHGYFNIDADIVYDVIKNELKHLISAINRLLESI